MIFLWWESKVHYLGGTQDTTHKTTNSWPFLFPTWNRRHSHSIALRQIWTYFLNIFYWFSYFFSKKMIASKRLISTVNTTVRASKLHEKLIQFESEKGKIVDLKAVYEVSLCYRKGKDSKQSHYFFRILCSFKSKRGVVVKKLTNSCFKFLFFSV